jgi:hypothetical protein
MMYDDSRGHVLQVGERQKKGTVVKIENTGHLSSGRSSLGFAFMRADGGFPPQLHLQIGCPFLRL